MLCGRYSTLSFRPDASIRSEEAIAAVTNCITELRAWMVADKLMLNGSKTEILLVGTRQQLQKVNFETITVGSCQVTPSSSVRNLGAWFDSELTMNTHVNKLCSAAYFHLFNIKRIRKYLTRQSCEKLVHAFVSSRIDYCNSLLYGLPAKTLNKVQRVLNTAARIIFRSPKWCHITPKLFALHWLPVKYRVDFKICLLTFKALHGLAPAYLSNLISAKVNPLNLRSSNQHLLSLPRKVTRKTLGDRAFAVAAPKLWNSLPANLRLSDSLTDFKGHLKTYLFSLAFCC